MSKSLRMENVQQGKLEKHQGTNKSRCTFEFSGVTKITCPQFYWPHMPKHRAVGARPFTHLQSTSWFILAWKCRLTLITPLRYIGWFVDSQVDFTGYLSAYWCLLSYFSWKRHLRVAKHMSYHGLSCWGRAVKDTRWRFVKMCIPHARAPKVFCVSRKDAFVHRHIWFEFTSGCSIPSNSQRMPGPRDWIHRCLATPGIAWGNAWLMRRLIDWCIQRWDRPVLSSTLQNLFSPTQIPKKLSTTKQNKTERKKTYCDFLIGQPFTCFITSTSSFVVSPSYCPLCKVNVSPSGIRSTSPRQTWRPPIHGTGGKSSEIWIPFEIEIAP